MNGLSHPLYAAIHAAEFPAQAILRLRPDLRLKPVAILEGPSSQEKVCSLNFAAKKRGVCTSMTRLEVEELREIHILSRSVPTELAARNVLLECASQFSSRIEETFIPDACGFVLEITGTERLFGPPPKLAESLRAAIVSAGIRASLCISSNFDTARIKASASHGITIIPPNKEAAALADLPISFLYLGEEHYKMFINWGIRTLGEFTKLPEEELIMRLGQSSTTWLQMSLGTASHHFQPLEANFELKEHLEFENSVEQFDSLLFIGAHMINSLVERASARALAIASLTIAMSLERSSIYDCSIRPAIPSSNQKFLLKLLQIELASHPPQAAVNSLTLIAEVGQQSKVQLGLFTPQAPEPSQLDVTLARLKALVGETRVGSPALIDSHRSESFTMEAFSIYDRADSQKRSIPRASLRRLRPQHLLQIQMQSQKPSAFSDSFCTFKVQVAYGPWHSSGSWWSANRWNLEEWDVIAINSTGESVGCLVVHDLIENKWLLNAFYD